MTHPDEQSHAVLAAALVHGPITLIVDPLCPITELLNRCGLAEVVGNQLVERGTALGSLHRVVVTAPIEVLRPQMVSVERTAQALIRHHIGHTALGVQFARLFLEILFGTYRPIGSMAAHAIVGRTGNVVQSRMQRCHGVTQAIVQWLRRIALVAATVDTDAGVVADFQHKVTGVIHKHGVIIRVGTISRIGQPKVLPHHNTIAVTGFKEFLVAGHAHPVAYHVVVHLLVMAHGSVKLSTSIVQVVLAECPVTAKGNQPAVVNIDSQLCVFICGFYLTDTCLEIDGIALHAINRERETGVIQVGLTVAVRPPQAHPLVFKLLELIGIK